MLWQNVEYKGLLFTCKCLDLNNINQMHTQVLIII